MDNQQNPSMVNEETLQDQTEFKAQEEVQEFIKNTATKPGGMMLKPPGPGEIMYCQLCREPMLPKDFSKDERTRQREFKWHMHNVCMRKMEDLADRSTPGLMNERRAK